MVWRWPQLFSRLAADLAHFATFILTLADGARVQERVEGVLVVLGLKRAVYDGEVWGGPHENGPALDGVFCLCSRVLQGSDLKIYGTRGRLSAG